MVKVFDNVVSDHEIRELLSYMHTNDHTTDERPDVRSNCPQWNKDVFPQQTIQRILDCVLENYLVETVLFYDSRISFRLHVDSADGDVNKLHKNILIPVWTQGFAGTVLFDNYWSGSSTRFSRGHASPFRYNLPDKNNRFVWVEDIRQLLSQAKNHPTSVVDFDVDDLFVQQLEALIQKRSQQGPGAADQRTSDYSHIVNYQANQQFDADFHQRYLSHVPIEDLHGLTVDRLVEWRPGSVIVFDRTQLHCAASGHDRKIGVSIFTNRSAGCIA